MPLTELEALAYHTDMKVRTALLDLLEAKRIIKQRMATEEQSVLEEERNKSMIAEIDSQIQQYKMSGLF